MKQARPPLRSQLRVRFACLLVTVLVLMGCVAASIAVYTGVRWGLRRESLVRLDPTGRGILESRIAALSDGVILLIGDSRLAGVPMPESVSGRRVVNLAVPGATSAQSALVLDQSLDRCVPSVVVIQVGINDLKAAGFGEDVESLANGAAANIRAMAQMSGRAGAITVVTAITPPGAPSPFRRPFWPRGFVELVDRANSSIEAAVGDVPGASVWAPNLPWRFRDSLHLDDETNRLWGERLTLEVSRRVDTRPSRSP